MKTRTTFSIPSQGWIASFTPRASAITASAARKRVSKAKVPLSAYGDTAKAIAKNAAGRAAENGTRIHPRANPNATTPVLVQASLDFGGVILTAAALSFLGLGAQEPTPEWGLMVNSGRAYFQTQWWLVTFPGLAILFTALAFNFVGDAMTDALNPRARKS